MGGASVRFLKSRTARLILLLAVAGGLVPFTIPTDDGETQESDLARPVKKYRRSGEKRSPVVAEKPQSAIRSLSTPVESPSPPAELMAATAAAPIPTSGLPTAMPRSEALNSPLVTLGKVTRYAERLLALFDRDRNGRLEPAEWAAMHGDPRAADLNGDGIVELDELTRHVADYGRGRRTRLIVDDAMNTATAPVGGNAGSQSDMPATPNGQSPTGDDPAAARRNRRFAVSPSRLPQGLPEWFLDRDADGDAQLTLQEFAPAGETGQQEEFRKLDQNNDGLLTASEYVRAASTKPAAKPSGSNDAGAETKPQ